MGEHAKSVSDEVDSLWRVALESEVEGIINESVTGKQACVRIAALTAVVTSEFSRLLKIVTALELAAVDGDGGHVVDSTFEFVLEDLFGEGQDVYRVVRGEAPFKLVKEEGT